MEILTTWCLQLCQMDCKVDPSGECSRNGLLIHREKHGLSPRIPPFFKVMFGKNFSQHLFVPPKFSELLRSSVGEKAYLEDSTGQKWAVALSDVLGSLAFQKGWDEFTKDHGLELGDFLLFRYTTESCFFVEIYGRDGYEKTYPGVQSFKNKIPKTTSNSITRKSPSDPLYEKRKPSQENDRSNVCAVSRSKVDISDNIRIHDDVNDVQNSLVVEENVQSQEFSIERPQLVPKVDFLVEPCFLIDRETSFSREDDRERLFDLSALELPGIKPSFTSKKAGAFHEAHTGDASIDTKNSPLIGALHEAHTGDASIDTNKSPLIQGAFHKAHTGDATIDTKKSLLIQENVVPSKNYEDKSEVQINEDEPKSGDPILEQPSKASSSSKEVEDDEGNQIPYRDNDNMMPSSSNNVELTFMMGPHIKPSTTTEVTRTNDIPSFLEENDNVIPESMNNDEETLIPHGKPSSIIPPSKKWGRLKSTISKIVAKKKTGGKWVPGGPSKPSLAEGDSRAKKKAYPVLVKELVDELCSIRRDWIADAGFWSISDPKVEFRVEPCFPTNRETSFAGKDDRERLFNLSALELPDMKPSFTSKKAGAFHGTHTGDASINKKQSPLIISAFHEAHTGDSSIDTNKSALLQSASHNAHTGDASIDKNKSPISLGAFHEAHTGDASIGTMKTPLIQENVVPSKNNEEKLPSSVSKPFLSVSPSLNLCSRSVPPSKTIRESHTCEPSAASGFSQPPGNSEENSEVEMQINEDEPKSRDPILEQSSKVSSSSKEVEDNEGSFHGDNDNVRLSSSNIAEQTFVMRPHIKPSTTKEVTNTHDISSFPEENDNVIPVSMKNDEETLIPHGKPSTTAQDLATPLNGGPVIHNNPPSKKRGRPKKIISEIEAKNKTPGKWVPGGPGRPPLGQGESKAKMQHSALRTYPGLVKELVDELCPIRRDWVVGAGFGSILDLKITKVNRYFMTWLEGRWDWKRQVLRIREDYEIVIDEKMISWITGVPIGSYNFPKRRTENKELTQLEKEYYGKKGIDYVRVYNKCLLELDDKDVFLRHFVLLTFGSLFCMNKCNFITPKLLSILKKEYITDPSEWNWCGFLYDWIAGHGKEQGKASALILLIAYLDRIKYTATSRSWKTDSPRIGAWQTEDLIEVIAQDMGPDGSFGHSEVVRDVVYGEPYPVGKPLTPPPWFNRRGQNKVGKPIPSSNEALKVDNRPRILRNLRQRHHKIKTGTGI
ncbi:uncharacterized protein [Spinacia oleracea]|uniref:Uncharacterized protein isoform X1 n=2 Tax=Spinacia oleracea TaxID=3562 RepID=A0ABM3RF93_SPIOL|nr:uncharacterized protein LOC110782465 isoform X1 [Spinacia oleracea]